MHPFLIAESEHITTKHSDWYTVIVMTLLICTHFTNLHCKCSQSSHEHNCRYLEMNRFLCSDRSQSIWLLNRMRRRNRMK